jgi:CubicO group peptidase (beta-lactamase class C family)
MQSNATTWLKASPENEGMSLQKLEEATATIQDKYPNLFGLLVIRHGKIVYERFYKKEDPNAIYPIHSVTKTFISTLIGIALEKGLIKDLDEKAVDILPDEFKYIDNPESKNITIRHLLTMSSGFDWPKPEDWHIQSGICLNWYLSDNWVKSLFSRKLINKPGEVFLYNTAVSHTLSVILTKKTGMSTLEFAKHFLFGPLQIKNIEWEVKNSIQMGGQGLELSIYDIAKLGQLFLQKGKWNTEQIVSEKWVQEATKVAYNCNYPGVDLKYGYKWWIYPVNKLPSYRAIGRGGQFIVVIPDLDMVIAVNSIINPQDYRYTFYYSYLFTMIAQAVMK